jgi:hypothetical protein
MFSDNITHIPSRKGDRKYSKANIDDTFNKLGWKPTQKLVDWIDIIKNGK